MIKVDSEAQKTDGYQRNDNLLLSPEARADSIPGLEIEADDVRCTHGATAGKVDEEMIFYARSRGLTRKEAIRTIVAGFFQTSLRPHHDRKRPRGPRRRGRPPGFANTIDLTSYGSSFHRVGEK